MNLATSGAVKNELKLDLCAPHRAMRDRFDFRIYSGAHYVCPMFHASSAIDFVENMFSLSRGFRHNEINSRYNRTNYAWINGSVAAADDDVIVVFFPISPFDRIKIPHCLHLSALHLFTFNWRDYRRVHNFRRFCGACMDGVGIFLWFPFFAAQFLIRFTISTLFFYFAYHRNIVRTPSRCWRARQTERNLNFQWSSRWFDYSEHTRHTSTRFYPFNGVNNRGIQMAMRWKVK